jgi:transposase
MTEDVSRYKQFCQFRSTIRSATDTLIVGIDIAKDRHHAFFGTPLGKTLWRRLIFDNNKAGYDKLITQVNRLCVQHSLSRVVFGLEPTGNYHKPLASWLIQKEFMVVFVSGKAVSDNRDLLNGRWDKNDTKDSANVADLVGRGKCQFYDNPGPEIMALRNLLSLRKRLKKEEHSLRMRIRNSLLAKFFPEMDRQWGSSLEENLAIIKWYLDPQKIAATDFDTFVRHVTKTDRGIRQTRRLKAIYDAAGISVGMPVTPSDRFEAKMLVEKLGQVRTMMSKTMEQVEKISSSMQGDKPLQSIPGFGPYIAALVLSVIGNPFRFNNRKQVIRLSGFDLNASRSGKTSNSAVPVISKRGNGDLRYALYQAALIATYHNEYFRKIYHRMLKGREAERGIRTKMRVKLAAKMLVIAWTLMKKNEVFDPSYLSS